MNMTTNVEIVNEINKDISQMEPPPELKHPIGDEKNYVAFDDSTSDTLKLWGIINKQANLIQKLMSANKSDSVLVKQLEQSKSAQKELSRKMETYKYITKCLQEKQTTLEEQIEILSAVDSSRRDSFI